MEFNIHKYDSEEFHSDELVDKRIRALKIWIEYQIFDKGLGDESELSLVTNVLNISIKQEWFEVAQYFKNLKDILLTK
jgi:hypothetical protein